jgi:hypothetical protein
MVDQQSLKFRKWAKRVKKNAKSQKASVHKTLLGEMTISVGRKVANAGAISAHEIAKEAVITADVGSNVLARVDPPNPHVGCQVIDCIIIVAHTFTANTTAPTAQRTNFTQCGVNIA